MSEQAREHVVVTVTVKRVTFEQGPNRYDRDSRATVPGENRRVVGDLLRFSATGETVAKAKDRAMKMLDVIDDETPTSTFQHTAMREKEA